METQKKVTEKVAKVEAKVKQMSLKRRQHLSRVVVKLESHIGRLTHLGNGGAVTPANSDRGSHSDRASRQQNPRRERQQSNCFASLDAYCRIIAFSSRTALYQPSKVLFSPVSTSSLGRHLREVALMTSAAGKIHVSRFTGLSTVTISHWLANIRLTAYVCHLEAHLGFRLGVPNEAVPRADIPGTPTLSLRSLGLGPSLSTITKMTAVVMGRCAAASSVSVKFATKP
ncbi:teashirt homolog 3-like protein [Lates japonicus]|uniref:Teashirt homolog 3-like protein n=1 Tax=Lates japonicus TaxID=270547 RepID=A0AAD3RNV7_LATJO|nr:teashirt homolog 3-like protein [Lates japonicus]